MQVGVKNTLAKSGDTFSFTQERWKRLSGLGARIGSAARRKNYQEFLARWFQHLKLRVTLLIFRHCEARAPGKLVASVAFWAMGFQRFYTGRFGLQGQWTGGRQSTTETWFWDLVQVDVMQVIHRYYFILYSLLFHSSVITCIVMHGHTRENFALDGNSVSGASLCHLLFHHPKYQSYLSSSIFLLTSICISFISFISKKGDL